MISTGFDLINCLKQIQTDAADTLLCVDHGRFVVMLTHRLGRVQANGRKAPSWAHAIKPSVSAKSAC